MKTKDAFALRDFDNQRIFQRPYFRRIGAGCPSLIVDENGQWLFGVHGYDDNAVLDRFKTKAIEAFDTDKFAEYQHVLDNLGHIVQNLSRYRDLLCRHVRRLERYEAALFSKIISGEIKLDAVPKRQTRHKYVKAIDAVSALQQSIEEFIAEFERSYTRIFAVRLRQARKAAGLTQTQLAEKIGMSQHGYSQYEVAGREPSIQKICQLSKILQKSADWLLGLTD